MNRPKERAYIEARLREEAELGPVTNAVRPTVETLVQYATRCEDATGIRIPAFSCENGVEVGEGTE
ncbi:MAG TPA: hypothetical protein VNN72_25220, partial [Polyangiaceae bacterium]|nr:hypothetical protein [Polyangiaceae bacterium]